MSKENFFIKHFGVIVTAIISVAIAISSAEIARHQIHIELNKHKTDSIEWFRQYEITLADFIVKSQGSFFEDSMYSEERFELLKMCFIQNEDARIILDSLNSQLADIATKSAKEETKHTNQTKEVDKVRTKIGWIYIGQYKNGRFISTPTINIKRSLLPSSDSLYKTIMDVHLRDNYAKGIFYKKGKSLGILKEDTGLIIRWVKNDVGVSKNHVWAKVEIN